MNVSYDRIIQKLSEQVEQAKQVKENPILLKQHISQIHVLCELILDESKNDFLDINQRQFTQINKQSSSAGSPVSDE